MMRQDRGKNLHRTITPYRSVSAVIKKFSHAANFEGPPVAFDLPKSVSDREEYRRIETHAKVAGRNADTFHLVAWR